jgi:uncharacterized FlgJ-related protein
MTAQMFYDYVFDLTKSKMLCDLVTAQAMHESNNFTSALAKDHNNYFGWTFNPKTMFDVATRGTRYFTDSAGVKRYYAAFKSDSLCIEWHIHYIKQRSKLYNANSLIQYVNALKSYRYFEDTISNYLKGMLYWTRELNKKGIKETPLVLLLPILYLLFR